ncbi:MAG: hypothetical protein LRZ85_10090 [Alphaproteobacteria bacterium]|nr:hypothetical protein [Alphaproteobacteria bacterium]MCD8570665.1 hypothetical protein [Alphaproteobacteria bacterium]
MVYLLVGLVGRIMADRKTGLLFFLTIAVMVLLVMVIRLSGVQPLVTQNNYVAVNLASGPIIRTYEIGKTYKIQLLQAIRKDPDNIVGVSARDLHVLFGNSSFIRQEGRASVWQYANGSCVLDIFFEAREGKAPELAPAAYYEVRSTSGNKDLDKESCVADLLKGNAGPYMVGVGAFYKSVME